MADPVVVDASAIVDLFLGTEDSSAVQTRLRSCTLHAPAHMDAEVLSAFGRLSRAGDLLPSAVALRLELLASQPVARHPLPPLLAGAWGRREELRLVDALYVELAAQLEAPLITTDRRLARATPFAELVTA